MSRLPASEARKRFADIVDRAQHKGERTILERRGKPVAAVIPIEELELLQQLEDRFDLEAAREALRETGTPVPWTSLKAELGL